jgi:hypothetical protein
MKPTFFRKNKLSLLWRRLGDVFFIPSFWAFLIFGAIALYFGVSMFIDGVLPLKPGVIYYSDYININGVHWSTRYVATPGTFARNKENVGLYLFGINLPVKIKEVLQDSSKTKVFLRKAINEAENNPENLLVGNWDPCPKGWRMPYKEELLKSFKEDNENQWFLNKVEQKDGGFIIKVPQDYDPIADFNCFATIGISQGPAITLLDNGGYLKGEVAIKNSYKLVSFWLKSDGRILTGNLAIHNVSTFTEVVSAERTSEKDTKDVSLLENLSRYSDTKKELQEIYNSFNTELMALATISDVSRDRLLLYPVRCVRNW